MCLGVTKEFIIIHFPREESDTQRKFISSSRRFAERNSEDLFSDFARTSLKAYVVA